jgi:type IV secretion system protein VirB9
MKKKYLKFIFLFFFISFFGFNEKNIFGDQYSKPLAINSHIRTIAYSPNEIHHYVGFYGYAASIVFEDGEEIVTIAMGDPQAWQLNPIGNRLFIKPIKENAATNALIRTNKRQYHFILNTREAASPYDKDLVFETRFVYSGSVITNFSGGGENSSYIPDLTEDYEKLNFDYLLSGNNRIKPIRVFDDGKFTYIQFHPKSTTMPAVFLVEEDGYESLVNVRTVGKFLVVERLGSIFTLRYDKIYVCIFNQRNPFDLKNIKGVKNPQKSSKKRSFKKNYKN